MISGPCPRCGGRFEVKNNRLATHEKPGNRIADCGSFRPLTCTGSGSTMLYTGQHAALALAMRVLETFPPQAAPGRPLPELEARLRQPVPGVMVLVPTR